jgi:hypothetical protein
MVLFCQTDVSGRTETDPSAETLSRNIVQYVSAWKPSPVRTVVYAGDSVGKEYLTSAGILIADYQGMKLSADHVLVVGPGGGKKLTALRGEVALWVRAGAKVLALGLDEAEANSFLPVHVAMIRREHISACFEPFGAASPLAGVSPAEVHNRDPRDFPLISEISGDATVVADGVLATAADGNVVLCQLIPWQFDYSGEKMNVKRTHRRVSCLLARLLGNMGAACETPILEHITMSVKENEKRWLSGLYLDSPQEWDDPYRFFRW